MFKADGTWQDSQFLTDFKNGGFEDFDEIDTVGTIGRVPTTTRVPSTTPTYLSPTTASDLLRRMQKSQAREDLRTLWKSFRDIAVVVIGFLAILGVYTLGSIIEGWL